MALSARPLWQGEQRVPPIPTLDQERDLRRHAGNAGRVSRSGPASAHGRQHRDPSTSLCRRHKKGTQNREGLGRSRGGFSTKIHARCDGKGRPVGFVLTPGQTHDNQGFLPLLRLIGERILAMIADKGYDADAIREELNFNGIEAVIPPKSNRKITIPYDIANAKIAIASSACSTR
jgi:transposase